jgi:hypothetical protein
MRRFAKGAEHLHDVVLSPPVAKAQRHLEAVIVENADPFLNGDDPVGVDLAKCGFTGQHVWSFG